MWKYIISEERHIQYEKIESVQPENKRCGNKHIRTIILQTGHISSEIALIGSYGNLHQRILIPFSTTDLSYAEFEEGYTSFNTSSVMLRSRYELFRSFFVGLSGGFAVILMYGRKILIKTKPYGSGK
jgi:hypothetical protein